MTKFLRTAGVVAVLLGSTTVAFGLTQSEKGRMNCAGMCIAVADEGNKILFADGNSSSLDSIKIAASRDINNLRSLPGATKEFDDFYQTAIDGMKDHAPDVKRIVVMQFLTECAKNYQVQ
jgi:hypothetical protein